MYQLFILIFFLPLSLFSNEKIINTFPSDGLININSLYWEIQNDITNSKNLLTASRLNFLREDEFKLTNLNFNIIEENNSVKIIKSDLGQFLLNTNTIEFNSNVLFSMESENIDMSISSEFITFDNNLHIIYSNSKTSFESELTKISSEGFKVLNNSLNKKQITFSKGTISDAGIQNNLKISGYADKINYQYEEDLLILIGSAEITDRGMTIKASEIHYDLASNKIIKSLDSKLTNNS
jgi:lipopolysaccharide export system protein LptA